MLTQPGRVFWTQLTRPFYQVLGDDGQIYTVHRDVGKSNPPFCLIKGRQKFPINMQPSYVPRFKPGDVILYDDAVFSFIVYPSGYPHIKYKVVPFPYPIVRISMIQRLDNRVMRPYSYHKPLPMILHSDGIIKTT